MDEKNNRRYFLLSKKEQELMDIFWEAEEPLSRAEILERAEQRQCSWKPNSIHILLNALLEKKAIDVAGYYLNSRKLGRTFQAGVTPQEYALMQLCRASQRAKEMGVPLKAQLAALKEPSEQ